MDLKTYIETAEKITGGRNQLATLVGQHGNALTDAKAGKRGLPNFACVKLAELLGIEQIEIIAASELVTEKNPERRKVWLPFVSTAEAHQAQMETAPEGAVKEDLVADYSRNLNRLSSSMP